MYREPDFLKLVDLIKGADLAVTHAEMLFHNYEDAPTHLSGGTYMRLGSPEHRRTPVDGLSRC